MRRIDPISFVATQLGTREVPNLGGIDDADDMTSLVQRARDAETIAPGGFQTGVNPSHPLGDQPIEEMAPSIRGVRKAPCAHLVAARHARVQRVFGNVDTQYPVDHCPILPPCLFSKSSASNNLVRRIYAHARPKIPSNLHSGAWKTGPNLPHWLIRQRCRPFDTEGRADREHPEAIVRATPVKTRPLFDLEKLRIYLEKLRASFKFGPSQGEPTAIVSPVRYAQSLLRRIEQLARELKDSRAGTTNNVFELFTSWKSDKANRTADAAADIATLSQKPATEDKTQNTPIECTVDAAAEIATLKQ